MTSDGEWVDSLPERLRRGLTQLREGINILEKQSELSALFARKAAEALLKHIVFRDSQEMKKNLTIKSLRERARQQNKITDRINMNLEFIAKIGNYISHDHDESETSMDKEIKLAIELIEDCYIWHFEKEGYLPKYTEEFSDYIRPNDAIQKAIGMIAGEYKKKPTEDMFYQDFEKRFSDTIFPRYLFLDADAAKRKKAEMALDEIVRINDDAKKREEKIKKKWENVYRDRYWEFKTTKGLKADLSNEIEEFRQKLKRQRQAGNFSKLRERARKHYIDELWTPKIGDLVRFKDKNTDFKGELIQIKPTYESNGRTLWMGLVSNKKDNLFEWFSLFDLIKITPDDFKDYDLDEF